MAAIGVNSGKRLTQGVLLAGLTALWGGTAAGGWASGAGEDLLDRVKGSVVYIQHEKAGGTGFIVSADGHIWTNAHVVDDQSRKNPRHTAERIVVVLDNGDRYQAKVIGAGLPARQPDCALLKIEPKQPLPYVKLGDSSKLRVGQNVYAIGQPHFLKKTVTAGIISHTRRAMGAIVPILQLDAAINPGNSGGPLFNEQGEVIGINTYGLGGPGLNGAFPINVIKDVEAMFREHGYFRPAGIPVVVFEPLQRKTLERFGLAGGVLVSQVLAGSSAEKAGLKRGDVLTAVDGQPLKVSDEPEADLLELQWRLSIRAPGSQVKWTVVRNIDDAAKRTTADVAAAIEVLPSKSSEHAEKSLSELGVGFTAWSTWNALPYRKTPPQSVEVSSTHEGSPMAKAGLQIGDYLAEVEGVKVTSPEQCEAELHKHLAARKKWIRLVAYRQDVRSDQIVAPEYALKEKTIALVCPEGKMEPKAYERVRQHFERVGAEVVMIGATREPVTLKAGESVTPSDLLSAMESSRFQGFVFLDCPEGADMLELKAGKDRLQAIMGSHRPVGAIGAAPAALVKALPELARKKLTCRPELLSKMGVADVNYTGKAVENDEMFVTANGAEDSLEPFLGSLDQALKRSLVR